MQLQKLHLILFNLKFEMLFSRNDTASCRRPRRRGGSLFSGNSRKTVCFSVGNFSPLCWISQISKQVFRMEEIVASQNESVIVFPLPPPGLWNTVRVQQILCSSFLGICQIPLPVKVGLTLYPLQNNPHTAPWFRRSALFCIYPWVLTPTKTRLKWTSTEWVLVWRMGWRRMGSETKELATRQGTGLTLRRLHLPLNGNSPFG